MKKGKLFIIGLIAILIAVIAYLIRELMKVQKSAMDYAGAKIKSLSFKNIQLTAYFKLTNPGMATITLINQDYDVYMNGKFVTHMKYSEPFTIKPGINIMPLEISANYGDLIKAGWSNLSDLLNDKSKVNISLKGTYTLKIGFLKFNKVALNENFNLGQLTEPKQKTNNT
jgi:LEA14-like dessication related protein